MPMIRANDSFNSVDTQQLTGTNRHNTEQKSYKVQ